MLGTKNVRYHEIVIATIVVIIRYSINRAWFVSLKLDSG